MVHGIGRQVACICLQEALFHKPRNQQQQPVQQLQPVRVADIQQLRTSVANLSQQVQKLQSCSGSPTQKQVSGVTLDCRGYPSLAMLTVTRSQGCCS